MLFVSGQVALVDAGEIVGGANDRHAEGFSPSRPHPRDQGAGLRDDLVRPPYLTDMALLPHGAVRALHLTGPPRPHYIEVAAFSARGAVEATWFRSAAPTASTAVGC